MFQQARHDRRKDHHDLNHQASTASLFNQPTQHDDGDESGNGAKLGSFGVVGLHTPDLPVALKDLVPSLSVHFLNDVETCDFLGLALNWFKCCVFRQVLVIRYLLLSFNAFKIDCKLRLASWPIRI
jgi:hypothetical protein